MGWPSYNEDLMDKITDCIQELANDISQAQLNVIIPQETQQKRLESIRKAVASIKSHLDEFMELATDPSVNLAHKCILQQRQIHSLEQTLVSSKNRYNDSLMSLQKIESKLARTEKDRSEQLELIEKLRMEIAYYKTPKSRKFDR